MSSNHQGPLSAPELAERIWGWLPARATRGRVTQPSVIAAALDVPVAQVTAELARMEHAGHAIRDRKTGGRAGSWHRGTPPNQPSGQADPEPGGWTLC